MTIKDAASIAGAAIFVVFMAASIALALHQSSECSDRGGMLVKDAVGRFVCIDPRTLPAPIPR